MGMTESAVDPLDMLPVVLTVPEVQKTMRISRVKAYELMHQTGFPVIRVGRAIRIPRDGFLKWLTNQAGSETMSAGEV